MAKKKVVRKVLRRSGFEDDIETILKAIECDYKYESKEDVITYTRPETKHKYNPDFVLEDGTILEGKGYFRLSDRKKQLLLKQQFPDKTIIIVFQNPNLPIIKGSKTRYRDWCDKHGIKWCTIEDLPKLIALRNKRDK